MSNFVSLDDAAKKLGVSTEELVEMRSRGEIFGYRDGGSWKFKPEEIERVAGELMGDALDEDPAGSSILSDLLPSNGSGSADQADAGSGIDSDVALVADEGGNSDVRLVASQSDDELSLAESDDDEEELTLSSDHGDDLLSAVNDSTAGSAIASGLGLGSDEPGSDPAIDLSDDVVTGPDSDLEPKDDDLKLADEGSELKLADAGESDLKLADSSGSASEVSIGSDLGLAGDPSGVMSGSDLSLEAGGESGLITGDSDPAIEAAGSDLELGDGDDLVLGGGSDLALGTDSGINLMSPADSGISLEDEPLDLAASGISGLDLAAEGSGSGSDVAGASAGGSAVDFQQDDEFQLSPSGVIDTDDDSGSQVIELEDSSEFGDAAVALPAGGEEGFDAFADVDGGGGLDEAEGLAPTGAPAAAMGAPEVPYSLLQVLSLLGILLLMCMSGILVTDVVRNMWAYAGSDSSLTSGFTDMVLSAFGQK